MKSVVSNGGEAGDSSSSKATPTSNGIHSPPAAKASSSVAELPDIDVDEDADVVEAAATPKKGVQFAEDVDVRYIKV